MNFIQKFLILKDCEKYAVKNNVGGFNEVPTEYKKEIIEGLYESLMLRVNDSYTKNILIGIIGKLPKKIL